MQSDIVHAKSGMLCENQDKFGRLCLRSGTARQGTPGAKWLCSTHQEAIVPSIQESRMSTTPAVSPIDALQELRGEDFRLGLINTLKNLQSQIEAQTACWPLIPMEEPRV